jgi:starch synthase
MKVLYAVSEVYPLIKTGGLADVAGALPIALQQQGVDIRLIMPAYGGVVNSLEHIVVHHALEIHVGEALFTVRLLEAKLPGSEVPIWLVENSALFERHGGPYGPRGGEWEDNPLRFTLFSHVVVAVARDWCGLQWQADLVHCNDWQSGLVPGLLAQHSPKIPTLLTIHNIAYQGVYGREVFDSLGLPQHLWSMHGYEFHGQLSFLKGGLLYADWINAVSPTYAAEIQTPAFGHGLEGVLQHRSEQLDGIVNGIDEQAWDPLTDPLIRSNYGVDSLENKAYNREHLGTRFDLQEWDRSEPLFGFIGRLVEQKGVDLILEAIPQLLSRSQAAFVLLGTGDALLEQRLQQLKADYPGRVGIWIGYEEGVAHQIEAGVDFFLMPSRFEPCGLNQLYSLRYGTPPIAHATGGLADTIIPASAENLAAGRANGFLFESATVEALSDAVRQARQLYRSDGEQLRLLQRNGMERESGWDESAGHYLRRYRQLSGIELM